MDEVWKDIPGYEGLYQVSNMGEVKSLARVIERRGNTPMRLQERILRRRINRKGYAIVALCKESEMWNRTVHRIVAQTFIPNPNNLPEINHINGVKTDNRMVNLEWVTTKANVKHSIEVLGNKRDIPKYAVRCVDTGVLYPSAKDAAVAVQGIAKAIRNVCAGGQKSHCGLHWEYVKGAHENVEQTHPLYGY